MYTQRTGVVLDSHLHHHSASQRHNIKDRRTQKDRRRNKRRKKTSLQLYLPLTLLQGLKRVTQSLHVRGCWRPNINFIFWPHCYDRHVVFFVLLDAQPEVLGSTPSGLLEDPSVGCGLPCHIWSLLSGSLLATPLAPNSTQLYNNSTPTRSPTGSLKSNF